MRESLGEAIQFFQGQDIVYFKYEEPEPEHPFGRGGGEFVFYTQKSGRRAFRFAAPKSIQELRKSISYLLRALTNHVQVTIVEDLHHILRRTYPDRVVVPEALIDMSMVYGFLAMQDKQWDTIHKAKMEEKGVVEVALEYWNKLPKRAKKFHHLCHVRIVKAYAIQEMKPIKVYSDENIPHNLYCQYRMNSSKTGRLSMLGGSKRGGHLLFNAHIEQKTTRPQALRADPGKVFIHADYISAEPRIIAAMSGDKRLQKIFDFGADPYEIVVEKAGMEHLGRAAGKAALIQTLYGARVKSIASGLGIDIEDARHLVATAQDLFPDAMDFMDEIAMIAVEDGFITTPTGRLLLCGEKANARRIISNYYAQSITADANTLSYTALIERCKRAVPLIHIHDGYVLETHDQFAEEDAQFVKEILEENPLSDFGLKLKLSCKIEIADHWIG